MRSAVYDVVKKYLYLYSHSLFLSLLLPSGIYGEYLGRFDNETISHKEIFSIYESFAQNIDFPGGSDGKASAYNVGDLGSIPGLGRSPGDGNDNPVSTLAWKIPQMEEPGKLQSMGSQRVKTRPSNFTSLCTKGNYKVNYKQREFSCIEVNVI